MKYYEICVKCGHVGKNNYYKGTIYISAENGRDAAKAARKFPRVKHDRKDAVLSVNEITYDEFVEGRKSVHDSPYWTCVNIQEQRMRLPEFESEIEREVPRNERTQYVKKHSLRKTYNESEQLFNEWAGYSGNINLSENE